VLQAATLGNHGQTHVPWSQHPKQTRGTPTHTHPTPPAHKQRRGVASYWSFVQDLNSVAKFTQLYSNWVILFGDFGCELPQPLQVTTYEGDSIHWDFKISKDLYFCEPQKCGLVKRIWVQIPNHWILPLWLAVRLQVTNHSLQRTKTLQNFIYKHPHNWKMDKGIRKKRRGKFKGCQVSTS